MPPRHGPGSCTPARLQQCAARWLSKASTSVRAAGRVSKPDIRLVSHLLDKLCAWFSCSQNDGYPKRKHGICCAVDKDPGTEGTAGVCEGFGALPNRDRAGVGLASSGVMAYQPPPTLLIVRRRGVHAKYIGRRVSGAKCLCARWALQSGQK